MATVDVQVDVLVCFCVKRLQMVRETGLQISWVFLCNNEYIYYRVTIVTVWFFIPNKEDPFFFISLYVCREIQQNNCSPLLQHKHMFKLYFFHVIHSVSHAFN